MPEIHYVVAIAAVLLTAISQLLLKQGASAARGSTLRLWLNGPTLLAYAMLVIVTLMNLYAYKVVPLRVSVVLSPLTLLLVTAASVFRLHERLTRIQIAGCLSIIGGIVIFNVHPI